MTLVRWLLGCLLIGLAVVAVSYLQHRFDRADLKKAVKAVEQKFPDLTDCRGEVISRSRGLIAVFCANQARSAVEGEARSGFAGRGGDASPSKWVVDVVKGEIAENGK